jgi:hypothetical protein
MRQAVRVVMVWAVAVSLVASTAAWRHCMAAQLAAQAGEQHRSASGHEAHDHLGMHHQHQPDAPAAPAAVDRGCLTCCIMCTAAVDLPTAPVQTQFSTLSSTVLYGRQPVLSDRAIRVDPGIPKRIA